MKIVTRPHQLLVSATDVAECLATMRAILTPAYNTGQLRYGIATSIDYMVERERFEAVYDGLEDLIKKLSQGKS